MIAGKEQLFTMDVDGTKIAFVLIAKDRHSIAIMGSEGSNVEVLTPRSRIPSIQTGRRTANA